MLMGSGYRKKGEGGGEGEGEGMVEIDKGRR